MNLAEQLEAHREIVGWVDPGWPAPPTAEDLMDAYYEENPEELEIEDPEINQYVPSLPFENDANEIAAEIGITTANVYNILQSTKRKLYRRLFILSAMDRMTEDELCEMICDKGAVAVFLSKEYG